MVIMCNESYLAPIQENTWELNTTLSLPIPEPKYRTKPRIEDPGHIVVRWNPVKVDENNPIFGFKVCAKNLLMNDNFALIQVSLHES